MWRPVAGKRFCIGAVVSVLALFVVGLNSSLLGAHVPKLIAAEQQQGDEEEDFPLRNLTGSFNTSKLQELICIPAICNKSDRFITSPSFTLLASFPGSGNTWTRTIIEAGTKVWTGSMYSDPSLRMDGFKGESLLPFRNKYARVSAIKTHYPYFSELEPHPKTTGVVLVMRSPFDAILAEYSRLHGKGASHRSQLEDFSSFHRDFVHGIQRWLAFAQYWIGHHRKRARVISENNVTSYEFTKKMAYGKPVPVLVLFYEDFVRNLVVTSERLFRFLKQEMGKQMPTTALEAVACTVTQGREKQNKEKRVHQPDEYNVYADGEFSILKRKLDRYACKLWAPYWFEEIWGPCLQPVPQVTRLPISSTQLLDRLANLGEYCQDP
ncbi:hypothetical protein BASA81_003052 [Batrachochytrium salamandrivorans]|nr:hypothetical protein BASA81_003052 [Batrachochytrium salamandrivorans]